MRKNVLGPILVVTLLNGRGARAQLAVVDNSNLLQNVKTALQTAQLVQTTASQLQLMEAQLQDQIENLKTINPVSIDGLLGLLEQSQLTFAMLEGDLNTIGFTIGTADASVGRLFPKTQSQWQTVRYSDFNAYYDGWHSEIATSSQAAIRAQTALSTLDANNAQVRQILAAANSTSTGEIRQLQLANQQLALIHAELSSLVSNLATVGRVIADWAAASAGEQMMSRERGRRRLQNYTCRGPPAPTLNRLP